MENKECSWGSDAHGVPVSSKRSANRKAKEYFGENYGVDWNQHYHPYNKNTPYTTIEDYYPTY